MFPLLCIIMSIKVELLLGYMYLVLKLYALSLTLYYIIIIVFYACEFGSFGDLFTQWGIDLFSPPDPFYRYSFGPGEIDLLVPRIALGGSNPT